jgi:hypothetical protein
VSRTGLTLAVGLTLVVIAIVVTLTRSPIEVLRSDSTQLPQELAETNSDAAACQGSEQLPAGTSAIRLGLKSTIGPRVNLTVLSSTRALTSGVTGSGWTGASVTVRVKPVRQANAPVRICFRLGRTVESVTILGVKTSPVLAATGSGGQVLPGRFKVEYLRAASSSWWSQASAVARRLGLGRVPSGTWVALLVMALMGAVVAGAAWLTLEQLR